MEATSIKPLAIKPMEVSFTFGPPRVVRHSMGQLASANWGSSTKCRCDTEEAPETERTGASSAKLFGYDGGVKEGTERASKTRVDCTRSEVPTK